MFELYIAIDERGARVDICNAEKGGRYFCPICHGSVIVREGKLNIKHFAHKCAECVDDWHYDMSEWHRHMQGFFPERAREVVVENGGKRHRADVLIGNSVIEFQHSSITASEFSDRNNFFIGLGYRIAWVFDVTEQYENGRLFRKIDDDRLLFIWKNPMRVFSAAPQIKDDNKKFSLWLTWNVDDESALLKKVIWTVKDDCNAPSLERFLIADYPIDLNGSFDVEEFFYSKRDHFYLKILKELHDICPSYSIKHVGKKGQPRDACVCPLRNTFGLDIFSERGCAYCRYCYAIAKQKGQNKHNWEICCGYPKQVRELHEEHPGYECPKAPIYNI